MFYYLGYGQGGGGSGPWGGSDNFGNNYQQGYGGGAVRNNYSQQRQGPYSKNYLILPVEIL